MKNRILLAVASVAILVFTAAPVQAEYFRQWIAPPECVIEAGLETQAILSEEECYELLNPPAKVDDTIEIPPDGDQPYGVSTQPKQVTVYPDLIDRIAPLTLRDIQNNTGAEPRTIRVDVHGYQSYDGTRHIIALIAVYIMLLSFLLYRSILGSKYGDK